MSIVVGDSINMSEPNTPTREGELVGSVDEIYNIPTPRIGQIVYVADKETNYIIRSLKAKTINGVKVPNAQVDQFEVYDLKPVKEEALSINDLQTRNSEDEVIVYGHSLENTTPNPVLKIPAANAKEAGVMTPADKALLNRAVLSYDVLPDSDSVNVACENAKSESTGMYPTFEIPAATEESAGVMTAQMYAKLMNAESSSFVKWDQESNMNNFKTAGDPIYICGERLNGADNLPIQSCQIGASFAGWLRVIDSSLMVEGSAPTKICITQILQISDRLGADGNTYYRTYTQNNGKTEDGSGSWSVWHRTQKTREGYIYTNLAQVDLNGTLSQVQGVTGIDNITESGMYSGIYTDDHTFEKPTFVETFLMIVINDETASSKNEQPRTVSQLMYAVNAVTNMCSVKKRVRVDPIGYTGTWGAWEEINVATPVIDLTNSVKIYGLPFCKKYKLIKEGGTYKASFSAGDNIRFDENGKIWNHITGWRGSNDDRLTAIIKLINNCCVIDVYCADSTYTGGLGYRRYITDSTFTAACVTAGTSML